VAHVGKDTTCLNLALSQRSGEFRRSSTSLCAVDVIVCFRSIVQQKQSILFFSNLMCMAKSSTPSVCRSTDDGDECVEVIDLESFEYSGRSVPGSLE